ncbi:hypothetical protein DPEC_G00205790 [Dallia pectoralis]|uniref:Uncharacterized protein n=1 Tax=Dallia pectoralis TaxID=75939 RepID=A0ACC2G4P2_DALPE|nr:hypothetical protein DPEC_G00205790 [Dallia pectoralis]
MGKSESQMDIMEKSTNPGKRRWTVAEIGLSGLLLLVSCALAGLIVLYTSALKEQSSRHGQSINSANDAWAEDELHNHRILECLLGTLRFRQLEEQAQLGYQGCVIEPSRFQGRGAAVPVPIPAEQGLVPPFPVWTT